MKTKILSLAALFLMGVFTVSAASKTDKIKVIGNCGMCEKRIEKAANSVEGVSKADWNKETKIMEVTFDDNKISVGKIERAIAKAGHDTPLYKATKEDYSKLPGCCKYTREAKEKE